MSLKEFFAVLAISTGLLILSLLWMGYDFSLLSDEIIMGYSSDTRLNSWSLYQALENLENRPLEPGYSEIFYGEEAAFAYTIAPYGIAFQIWPVYWLSGQNVELTYNLYWLLTTPLTALATFAFIRYLFRPSFSIALLISLLFTFSQVRDKHFGQIESFAIFLIILCLLCFHRLIDRPHTGWALALGITFTLTILTSGYQGMYFILMAGSIFLYVLVYYRYRLTRQHWIYLTISAVLGIILSLPFLLFRFQNNDVSGGHSLDSIAVGSATLENLLLNGAHIYRTIIPVGGSPERLFPGILLLVLAGMAVFRFRNHRYTPPEEQAAKSRLLTERDFVRLYGFFVVVGTILMWGPKIYIQPGTWVPGPYYIFTLLPGFSVLRAPQRFYIVVIIGLIILAAYALTQLSRRTDTYRFRQILALVAVLGFIETLPANQLEYETFSPQNFVESFSVPSDERRLVYTEYREQNIQIYRWLEMLPPETPVYHYPHHKRAMTSIMAWQYLHQQPTLNGAGSYLPDWYDAGGLGSSRPGPQFLDNWLLDIIQKRGIVFLIIHYELLDAQETHILQKYLEINKDACLETVKTFAQVEVFHFCWN